MSELNDQLDSIRAGLAYLLPEAILASGVLVLLIAGLLRKNNNTLYLLLTIIAVSASMFMNLLHGTTPDQPVKLFQDMVQVNDFTIYLNTLFDCAGILTVVLFLASHKKQVHSSEYFALLLAILTGAHLLVISTSFVMVFLSLELISIPSYLLAGFGFQKRSAEGSLKYFLFGSVSSAIMLYGFSILYGLTGTLDFSSAAFSGLLLQGPSPLLLMAGLMVLAGFLFKIAAFPMHLWAPDIYEAAPTPVIAFFSVVPKLAGIGILARFLLAINLFGESGYSWQTIIAVVALLTLTVGNFGALAQQHPRRLMAYSSIAQSGFLLVGIAAFSHQGIQFMLFYATVYLLMNFLVFHCLDRFESAGIHTISQFKGMGKQMLWPSVFLLTGLIALTGLPPTSGFTAKLFIFTSLWQSYQVSGNPVLLWLVLFGLLNTVVALFYYLKIPYYAFLKSGETEQKQNIRPAENLFGLILVVLILILFFRPGLLMGWINKINFVL